MKARAKGVGRDCRCLLFLVLAIVANVDKSRTEGFCGERGGGGGLVVVGVVVLALTTINPGGCNKSGCFQVFAAMALLGMPQT